LTNKRLHNWTKQQLIAAANVAELSTTNTLYADKNDNTWKKQSIIIYKVRVSNSNN